jgi:hypothetical protein
MKISNKIAAGEAEALLWGVAVPDTAAQTLPRDTKVGSNQAISASIRHAHCQCISDSPLPG